MANESSTTIKKLSLLLKCRRQFKLVTNIDVNEEMCCECFSVFFIKTCGTIDCYFIDNIGISFLNKKSLPVQPNPAHCLRSCSRTSDRTTRAFWVGPVQG